jgi:hypothetical protein
VPAERCHVLVLPVELLEAVLGLPADIRIAEVVQTPDNRCQGSVELIVRGDLDDRFQFANAGVVPVRTLVRGRPMAPDAVQIHAVSGILPPTVHTNLAFQHAPAPPSEIRSAEPTARERIIALEPSTEAVPWRYTCLRCSREVLYNPTDPPPPTVCYCQSCRDAI